MSYYQDATSYNTRRRTSKMAPKVGVNEHALDAAAAVDRQREPLSPEIVARFKADRLWHLREFDSLVPAGRQDALQLRTWLTSQCVVSTRTLTVTPWQVSHMAVGLWVTG